ncbi:MAG: NADH-quinone oxidoreductase subunit M [Gammaproteobacteria bacterium]|nr:NADH-quinone oxidoreductase subunit M [Gammaproteobacteria bacterium]
MTAEPSGIPLLTLMLMTPLFTAALIWFYPEQDDRIKYLALGAILLDLLLAFWVLGKFDPTDPGFQLTERVLWISTLNIHYFLGVDGISVLFLPLTVLLFLGVVLASWTSVRLMKRLYFSLVLLLLTVTLGLFCALDTILFFLFWEATLLPLYFLISLWGTGPNRRYAAAKYTLFMLAGGIPLLFGFVLLAFDYAAVEGTGVPYGLMFDYPSLLESTVTPETQRLLFFLLLVGFAVKVPLFPVHSWLPVVAQEGPVAVIALMTGLKLGVYGLLRFVVPLTPDASLEYHWLLAGLGVVGILYGGVLAMVQTNLRGMLAFSSISHVGLVVLGISSFTIQSTQGALFQILNFTLIAGGIFLLTGFLHHRIGSTDFVNLGGAAESLPMLAAFVLFFGLAGMGMPGTSGFPAEFLLLTSAVATHTGAGLAALFGVVLGAGYFLGIYRRVFLGPVRNSVVKNALDLRPRELFVVCLFGGVILLAGLYPAGVLELTRVTAEGWLARIPIGG